MIRKNQENILKLSIPLFFEMLLIVMVQNVDQLMLSGCSQEAVAAVGNAGQISWVMLLFFNVLSMASIILITQNRGAGDEETERSIYPVTTIATIAVGIVLSLICIFGMRFILTIMKVEEGLTFDYALLYMQITGGTILFQAMAMGFAAYLKSNEFVKEAMWGSITVNILNVIGNALAIYCFHMDVAGVAISTAVSRFVGMVLAIVLFRIKVGKMSFKGLSKCHPMRLIKQLLQIGIPSAGENISYDTSQLVVMGFINTFGLAAVNAKIYVSLVIQFAFTFTVAVSGALQIVEGYLIGANRRDEAARKVYFAMKIAVASSLSLSILLFIFSNQVVGLFPSADAEVLRIARQILFVEIFLEIGRALNIVLVRALQTAGDVRFPVYMSVIFTWCVSVVLGYILGVHCDMGLLGIWIAMACDEVLRGIVLLIRFKNGKWRSIHLVREHTADGTDQSVGDAK